MASLPMVRSTSTHYCCQESHKAQAEIALPSLNYHIQANSYGACFSNSPAGTVLSVLLTVAAAASAAVSAAVVVVVVVVAAAAAVATVSVAA